MANLPRYRPGEAQLSAEGLNDTAEIIERMAGGLGATGQRRVGNMVSSERDDSLWIRLTSFADVGLCYPAYSWEEVVWDPSVCNWVTLSGGRSGAAFDLPAFEANGSRSLEYGDVRQAWFAPDGLSVQFQRCKACRQCPACVEVEGYTTVYRVWLGGFSGTHTDGLGRTYEFAELNGWFHLGEMVKIFPGGPVLCAGALGDTGKRLPDAALWKYVRIEFTPESPFVPGVPASLLASIVYQDPFGATSTIQTVTYTAPATVGGCGLGDTYLLTLTDIGRATTAPAFIIVEALRRTFDCKSSVWIANTDPLGTVPPQPQCVSNDYAMVRRTAPYLWEGMQTWTSLLAAPAPAAPVERYQSAWRLDVTGDPIVLDYWNDVAVWLAGGAPLARGVLARASFANGPGAVNFFPVAVPPACPTLTGLWLRYVNA